jgi:serine/threonine-protein kinase
MQKDPADRYQSAGEMRNDIQRALSGAPVAAPMLTDAYGAGTRRMGSTATQVAGRTTAVPPYQYGPTDGGPDGPMRPRRIWPWVALFTVVVVLAAAIIAIKYISSSTNGVPVPTLSGQTLKAARSQLLSAGFKVGNVTHQASATVPKDRVIGTNPGAGTSEPKGTTIGIIESTGPSKVLVPSVVGLSEAAAISQLHQANLTANPQKGHNSAFAPGQVFSQSPQAGKSVAPNSTVTIWVNRNTPSLTVPPSVIGLKQDWATQVLQSSPYYYVVTPIIQLGGGAYAPGLVWSTNPSPGTPLAKGSPITIYINPQATPSPTTSPTPSSTASPTPSSTSPTPNPT